MKIPIAVATVLAGVCATATTALAAHDEVKNDRVAKYTYALRPVQDASIPNSRASGTAKIMELPNGSVKVVVTATGLAPNLPHLMHLHDHLGPTPSSCPAPTPDDVVTVLDGLPAYGPIQLPLDTVVADADGSIDHTATFPADTPIGDGTLADIAGFAQVVVHGIDLDGNGEYAINPDDPFAGMTSSIVPGAPLELTVPVLCGGVPN